MNPYLAAGLALVGMIIIATILTSYLAVYFTRKAKEDLREHLTPLAAAVQGEANVNDAVVCGARHGTHVYGRMAAEAAGTVRVWQTDIMDAAGGHPWTFVWARPRKQEISPRVTIEAPDADLRAMLEGWTAESLQPLRPAAADWLQLHYDPAGGYVRLVRPMSGRNDIPTADHFLQEIDWLIAVGDQNRSLLSGHQETPSA